MKKYRIAMISLLLVLALSIAGGIISYAIPENAHESISESKTRLFAKRTRQLELFGEGNNSADEQFHFGKIIDKPNAASGGGSIAAQGTSVAYKNTVTYYDDYTFDIYTDENGNEYSYDLSGNLVSFKLDSLTKDINTINASDLLSEEQAIEKAEEYAYALYGSEFNSYEHEWTVMNSDIHTYTFSFAKKYGYAVGERCFIDICTNGLLFGCDLVDYQKFDDFDIGIIEDIPEQQLLDDIDEYVKCLYPDNLVDYDVDSVNLKKLGDKYYLKAAIDITYRYNGDVLYDGQEYYYELG